MTTHVKVSRAVHDMLKEKKDELGLRSVDCRHPTPLLGLPGWSGRGPSVKQ